MAVELPGSEDESAARAVIEQAGAALAARRSDIPATFVAQLYAPRGAGGRGALCARPISPRWPSGRSIFSASGSRARRKSAARPCALKASGERKSVSVIEIVNDDMPFLVDSVMGEIAERRLDVRLVAHPVFGVRRDGGKLVALGARRCRRRRARKLHPYPSRADRGRGRARRHRARARGRARRSAAGGAGLARHARARQRHRRRAEDQSAAAAGGRDRRGDPVPAMAAGRQFHLPRRARLHLRRQRARSRISTARSASCARANCACSSAATSCSNSRRRSWRS